MNGSSRLARHRGELVFAKSLLRSIDQHLNILEFEAWKEIAHELEKTGDRFASLVLLGNPERGKIGISKAPSSANISAAFFRSLSEKAVNSSMSSFAFFLDMFLAFNLRCLLAL